MHVLYNSHVHTNIYTILSKAFDAGWLWVMVFTFLFSLPNVELLFPCFVFCFSDVNFFHLPGTSTVGETDTLMISPPVPQQVM